MSELDKWFGHKEKIDEEEREHKTGMELLASAMQPSFRKLLRCEDRIKGVLATFFEAKGEDYWPRSPQLRSEQYSAARVFVDEFGEDEEAVRWCLQECDRRKVQVKTLRSVLYLAPDWRAIARRPEIDLDAEIEFKETRACSNCGQEAFLELLENELCVECRMLPSDRARELRRERMLR